MIELIKKVMDVFFYGVNRKDKNYTALDGKSSNDGCRISWKKNLVKFMCVGFNALSG